MILRRLRAAALTCQGRALAFYPDAVLTVAGGRILSLRAARGETPRGVRDLRRALVLPGLVDAHCHLSQYAEVASDAGELLPWLKTRIFPAEAGFRGDRVRPLARRFFRDLAAHGTTSAAVYTSVWRDSTEACFEEALASGLRVIMGKVMMDRGSYDRHLRAARAGESRRELSLRESAELCERWHGAGEGRIRYAFTPRFALSCSPELLAGAARLAERYGAHVQTHLSENRSEIRRVRRRFGRGYAEVYDRAGLLSPRTVLAHGVWLGAGEVRLLARRGAGLAHCPTSNAFLSSGIMDLGAARRARVPVGLGSDVAGGPTLDMFEVMRQAVYAQRLAKAHGLFDGREAIGPVEAFTLATLGGARALGLGERIGSLEPGKEADFIVLDPRGVAPRWPLARPEASEVAAQVVFRGSRAAVRESYVAGRLVHRVPRGVLLPGLGVKHRPTVP